MKYEYKIQYKDNCFEDSVTETNWLNEMGNEGWELVRASQRTSSSRIYYFKRAVPSPDDKDKEISRLKNVIKENSSLSWHSSLQLAVAIYNSQTPNKND